MKRETIRQIPVAILVTWMLALALAWLGRVSSAAAQPHQAAPGRQHLVGSWLVTYDVEAFGTPIPILLSFGRDGVMLETDTPAPTPVGPLGTLILSNGHGAWVAAQGHTFRYLYRKLIYREDGLTPFGTTRTQATGMLSANGTQFQAELLIEFLDTQGKVQLAVTGTATGSKIQVE